MLKQLGLIFNFTEKKGYFCRQGINYRQSFMYMIKGLKKSNIEVACELLKHAVAVFLSVVFIVVVVSCQNDKDKEPEYEMLATEYQNELFSIVTLNVDGLPARIGNLPIEINPEGPGAEYSPLIGEYLASKGYDFIAVQEDFNYNEEIITGLGTGYCSDVWSGGLSMDRIGPGLKFPFDGVNGFWKKELAVKRADSVAWTMNYGKFDHAADDLITKGFRRYDIQLKGSSRLVVYNMHLDASDEDDEIKGNDGPDRKARMTQWRQLRDYIIRHIDKRPVIVTGDLNSYYSRDSIRSVFMDYIEEKANAQVNDAWVVLQRGGEYPELQSAPVLPDGNGWMYKGEGVDKIIYINPAAGGKLVPVTVDIDTINYLRSDGTPIGDHFPLSATFRLTRSEQ